jgi:anti-sigma regulatory factor (Ser/Thr protein kinase)
MPKEPDPKESWGWRFGVTRTTPYWARVNTKWFLERCQGVSRDLAEDVVVVVSELVTNAYTAATNLDDSTLIDLSLRLFNDHLLVEVIDSSPEAPMLAPAKDAASENGRGLYLVNELSRDWGYFWHQGRKVVYCILSFTTEK